MTKERLEELIKQGGTIYRIVDNEIIEMGLANEIAEIYGDMLYYQDGIWWYIKDLFETKDRAEWALKTVAERVERFEPPMWEDIENEYKIDFIEQPDKPIYFYVSKEINAIFIRDVYEDELIEVFDATKEDYEKACEIVRDLFKGEK